jgi:hypothetical protein
LLHPRPLASILLLVWILLVHGLLVWISRIGVRRVCERPWPALARVIRSRGRMSASGVLRHIFAHTGTRFGIVSHWKRLLSLMGQPARSEHVPKEQRFLRYGLLTLLRRGLQPSRPGTLRRGCLSTLALLALLDGVRLDRRGSLPATSSRRLCQTSIAVSSEVRSGAGSRDETC